MNDSDVTLEQDIRIWLAEHPNQREAGNRMLTQLAKIQSEFDGDTRERLEALVQQTFDSHREIMQYQNSALTTLERATKRRLRLVSLQASARAAVEQSIPAKRLLN